jgi:arsenite/tail-anchored protein-transporting ATPase
LTSLRVVLFAGRGGVGTTTAAAATAVHAARSAKVLLVSAGPVDAALGVPLGPDPVAVGELHAQRVDVRREFEARWPEVSGWLPGLDPVAAAELALPPGAAELVTLLAARDRAAAGNWDAVLVDGPPTGALLALAALAGSVQRIWPSHQRIVRRSALADAVSLLQSELESVRDLLAGASVRLVLAPDRLGVAEGRRTLTALALHGYAVDSVLANRLLPEDGSPWLAAARAGQEAALAGLEADVPVRRAAYRPVDPVGPAALEELGAELYTGADPLAPGPVPVAPAVSRSGSDYELRLTLPYVRRSEVRLARSGDELVVTVGDQLRRLLLPSVLRRCVAVGASAGDGAVRVRFRPDPALWPQELAR